MSFELTGEHLLYVFNAIVLPALGWVVMLLWRTATKLAELAKDVEGLKGGADDVESLKRDLDGLKRAQEHMPTKDQFHGLALQISGMEGEVKAILAKFTGFEELNRRLESVVTRQETYLLNAAGGKGDGGGTK